MRIFSASVVAVVLCGVSLSQESQKVPPHPGRNAAGPAQAVNAAPRQQFAQRSKFALNVLNAAVALPQSNLQDRLRVLVSAARLANVMSPQSKKALTREGMEIEARLIANGEQPQVSMVESGLVDCASVASLVDAIRPEALFTADRTISAAVNSCPKQALEPVERKLTDALARGSAPPQALWATMQAAGPKSMWTSQQFGAVFSSLPDPKDAKSMADAPLYASLYERFAVAVDAGSARNAGAKLLAWLGKMDDSPGRVQAAGTATAAIKKVLGEEGLQEILESDPIANQSAQLAGRPVDMPMPEEQADVSVGSLDTSADHTNELSDYPAPRRAREGAAYGFAAGNKGDKDLAERYFEIAFSALNDIWSDRLPGLNMSALVEEVSQAAASVDPVSALKHAQRLEQNSAQAVAMLAVAQTVLTRQPQNQRPTVAQEQR